MSDWRPFQLLGRKRLAGIAERIQAALEPLTRDWWAPSSSIQLAGVSAWSDHAEQLRASPLRFLVRDGDLWLALLGHEQVWRRLAGSWLGCEVILDSALTEHLQREFALSLFGHLVGRETPNAVLSDEELPRIPVSALRRGAGTLVIELDIDGVPLMMVAPIELWPSLAIPPVAAARSAFTAATQALTQTRIKLDVQLAAVQMPLTELASLSAGDFLDLAHDLSGRVRVSGAGLNLSLAAALGQHTGCKAIRMEMDERTKA